MSAMIRSSDGDFLAETNCIPNETLTDIVGLLDTLYYYYQQDNIEEFIKTKRILLEEVNKLKPREVNIHKYA